MAGIGTTYQSYFNGLVYRSGIYQKRALAGQENWVDFIDGENPATLWNQRNELDVLDGKPFKELKYMHTMQGGADFNDNYATQTFWTEGSKDYTDTAGNFFQAESPHINSDPDGVNTGVGRHDDGYLENWADSSWNKAVQRLPRDTANGGNGVSSKTYQVNPTVDNNPSDSPGAETGYNNQVWVDYATEADETVKQVAYTNANNANGLAYPLANSQSELYFTQKQRYDH